MTSIPTGFDIPACDSQEFREFCDACYNAYALKPSLSLVGLHSFLTVASASQPMSYSTLAKRIGQNYTTVTNLSGILSDGRGQKSGLNILRRVPGNGRKEKRLEASEEGYVIARHFTKSSLKTAANPEYDQFDDRGIIFENLIHRTLPALKKALISAPDMHLSTFCALLFICQNQKRFTEDQENSSIIGKKLSISNLTRTLCRLSEGYSGFYGYGLLDLYKKPTDRRVTLPVLSHKGAKLMSDIAELLQEKTPETDLRSYVEILNLNQTEDQIENIENQNGFDF